MLPKSSDSQLFNETREKSLRSQMGELETFLGFRPIFGNDFGDFFEIYLISRKNSQQVGDFIG